LETEKSIVEVVAYFDMFHYPVSATEIHQFLRASIPARQIEPLLQQLVAQKKLFRLDEFYSLRNDPSLAAQRRSGNERAGKLLPIAYRIGKLLHRFPFVKGIGISGSLSKDYADKDADIDFFVITKTNKLWIARSFLHALKKLSFVFGKQHWLCMNYFVDEAGLELIEKNIFIATEVVTLKPVSITPAIQKFFSANDWTSNYFPNYRLGTTFAEEPGSWIKRLIESIFNNRAGNWLDNCLMRVTERRWLQKEKRCKLNMKGEIQSLRVSKHFARPNPEFFQKKILAMYDAKLKSLEEKQVIQPGEQFHFLRKEII
jgi:predicted nucleotidyltransferase